MRLRLYLFYFLAVLRIEQHACAAAIVIEPSDNPAALTLGPKNTSMKVFLPTESLSMPKDSDLEPLKIFPFTRSYWLKFSVNKELLANLSQMHYIF